MTVKGFVFFLLVAVFAATGTAFRLPVAFSQTVTWSSLATGPTAVVTIPSGQTVVFDPRGGVGEARDLIVNGTFQLPDNANATLRIHRNFIIDGGRTIRGPNLRRFTVEWPSVDEATFVGGGDHTHALATDPGLWILRGGRWEINGDPKRSWMRATSPLASGVSQITLPEDPTGWQVGDDVLITPTESVAVAEHWMHHEVKTISAIAGRAVTFTSSLQYPHPTATIRGVVYGAEIANLSRNVRLVGRPTGRPHIMLTALTGPQKLAHLEIRYFGPRTSENQGVLGRYPLHFHRNADATRGSTVTAVVIRDSGNMGFVPHASHGISFVGTVIHNFFLLMRRGAEAGYWWDQTARGSGGSVDSSHDILYEDAGASFGQRVSVCSFCQRGGGFTTSSGLRNKMVNIWASGMQAPSGGIDLAGLTWGEGSTARAEGVWVVAKAILHNCLKGAFAWTNDTYNAALPHPVDDVVTYRNSQVGIDMGAYANSYLWLRPVSAENGAAALRLHSQSMPPEQETFRLTFQDGWFDASGLSDYAMVSVNHATAKAPTVFRRNTFTGGRRAGVGFIATGGTADISLFESNTYQANAFWFLANTIPTTSRIQVRADARFGNRDLRRYDQSGSFDEPWNARVTVLP